MKDNKPDMSKPLDLITGNHLLLSLVISLILYLSLNVIELAILIFPIVPIIYGIKTKDVTGSVMIGMLPSTCLFLDLHLTGLHDYTPERFGYVLTYFGQLIAVGGMEGYLAAKQSYNYFIMAVVFLLLWYFIFMTGIS